MPVHPHLTPNNPVLETARAYVRLGLPVIPLSPDSKVAAVSWSSYQRRLPTDAELVSWFGAVNGRGIGLVTGVVSGRLVLDFDVPALYERFCQDYPRLADTYTVRTRRGYHLYYRVTERLTVASQQLSGLDVQFEGRYVVAPPTQIDGHAYAPHRARPEQWLTFQTKRHLTAFLRSCAPAEAKPAPAPMSVPEPQDPSGPLTGHPLIKRYQALAATAGRNHALFRTACHARDRGVSQLETLRVLTLAHIHQPAPAGHPPQSLASRETEARRTIASVYTRPPRPPQSDQKQSYLPNTVREHLCQQGFTCAARVLEALHLSGFRAGDTLSTRQVKQACAAHGVGDWSVRRALGAQIAPLALPPGLSTASPGAKQGQKHAVLDRITKPTKNTRGRPGHHYQMPSAQQLARKLNLRLSVADPIREADLRTVHSYRAALHARHLERRPGQYSRQLLADRFCVSFQTVRRYDLTGKVRKLPLFTRTPLFFHNVKQLVPADGAEQASGAFLQDARGRRYPPKHALALRLIRQGRVWLVVQEPNFYWVGETLPVLPDRYRVEGLQPPAAAPARTGNADLRLFPRPTPAAAPVLTRDPAPAIGVRTRPQHDPDWQRQQRLERGEGPLTPERLAHWAGRVYETVNARVAGELEDKRLSRETARRLVTTHGVKAIERALWILGQRQNIEAPAGFLIAVLRSKRR